MIHRRHFLRSAALGATAAATLPRPALAQGLRELKMITTWPKNFPGLGTAAERLAKRVGDATSQRITIKVYAAGELVPPFESFDAVSSGAADLYHGADYYWQNKSKAYNFFTAVPFGMTATELNAWIQFGGGQKLWDDLSAGFGIKPFLAGNTGVQMGGWFRKEVNSLEDWKGLKFRMPGLGGEVLLRIGAGAVNLPVGDIFPALQGGAIDATEWVGPWNDLALGLYKVAEHYYYPGFHEPGSALNVGINLRVWNGLSADQQAVFQNALAAENDAVLAEFNANNAVALTTLVDQHKVKIRKFSDDVIKAIGEMSGQVVAETGTADPVTKKFYDSFIDFRRKSMAWARLSDQAYANARLLPFKYGT